MRLSKRIMLLAVATGSTGILLAGTTFAADVITDTQITSIRNQCGELKATLTRLRQNDTLLRINRGQLYRAIADKLMTPLNKRIASNNLDDSTLVPITATFNDTYQKFYNDYKIYDLALDDVLTTDCQTQPTQFYSALQDAREKRITLGETSQELTDLAVKYKKAVQAFTKKFSKEASA